MGINLKKLFYIFPIIFIKIYFLQQSFAQVYNELIERSYILDSEKENIIEAKKEIQSKALDALIEELSKEIIGEDRFNKNKNVILSKLTSRSSRFIPFSKNTEPIIANKKTSQTVQLKINLKEFKQVLKELNLLEETVQKLTLMPLVKFEDSSRQKSYKWWGVNDDGLKKWSLILEDNFQQSFLKNGIFMWRPTYWELNKNLTTLYVNDKWDFEQMLFLEKNFQTPFVLEGIVQVKKIEKRNEKSFLVFKFNLIQVQQNKVLTDLLRQIEIPVFKNDNKMNLWIEQKIADESESMALDLAQQFIDINQRGILNTQKVNVQFLMSQVPTKLEVLKEKLKSQSSVIKNIHERELTAQYITYEIDFSGSVTELQSKILAIDLGPLKNPQKNTQLKFVRLGEKELVFEIK